MRIVRSIKQLRPALAVPRSKGQRLGLVPTMGALHEGHLSLIRLAKRKVDFVVVSIFVNPIQFGPNEDYERYPRDLRGDALKCREVGADLIFAPGVKEIYPEGFSTYIDVEGLTQGLCGSRRPGHFRGVATVVGKLFNLIQPDLAVFGQKDAQQVAVIKQMVQDLSFPIEIVVGPIVRDPDGLALSSRNAYLTPKEREQAPALYRSLMLARRMFRDGEQTPSEVRRAMVGLLKSQAPLGRVEYIEIVDNRTMQPVKRMDKGILVAIAVKFPNARLIDNIVL